MCNDFTISDEGNGKLWPFVCELQHNKTASIFKMLTSNNKKQKSSLLAAGFFFKGHLDARLKRVFSHREDRYGSIAE